MTVKLSDEQKRINKLNKIKDNACGNSLKDDVKYKSLRDNFVSWEGYPELGVDDVNVNSTTIKGLFTCSTPGCENMVKSRAISKMVFFNEESKCPKCQKHISALKRTKTEAKKGNTIGNISQRDDGYGKRARFLKQIFVEVKKYPELKIEDCTKNSKYIAEWICLGRQSDKCKKVFPRSISKMMSLDRYCYCESCSKIISAINKNKKNAQDNPLSDSPRFKEITNSEEGLIFLYCIEYPELREKDLTSASSYHAKWKCKKCNQSFQAIINNVICKKSGCPYCSGLLPLWGKNDLYTYCLKNRPDLFRYWVPEKNGPMENYTYCCDKRVSWLCPLCGSKFERAINKRIKSRELCSECSKYYKDSIPQRLIKYYLDKFLVSGKIKYGYKNHEWLDKREIDVYVDDGDNSYAIEYDGYLHRINADLKKDKMCKDRGIKLIRVRDPNAERYNERNIYGVIIIQRQTSAIDDDLNDAIKKVLGIVGIPPHKIDTVNVKKDVMHVLRVERNIVNYEKSLEYCKPRAAAFFDKKNYEDGEKSILSKIISANSNIPCSFAHTDEKNGKIHNWMTIPKNIVDTDDKPYTCPVCRNKYFIEGVNDFATLYPDLLKEWDFYQNEKKGIYPNKLLGAPGVDVNWFCQKHQYPYVATPNSRVCNGSGCKYCGREKMTRLVEAINTEDGRVEKAASVSELAHKIGYKQNSVSAALASGKILGKRRRLICSADREGKNIIKKYKSLNEASSELQISKDRIRKARDQKTSVEGLWFFWEQEKMGWKVTYLDEKKKQGKRKVKNLESGRIYDSIKAASVGLGINRTSISVALKTGHKGGGYHWEYVE